MGDTVLYSKEVNNYDGGAGERHILGWFYNQKATLGLAHHV